MRVLSIQERKWEKEAANCRRAAARIHTVQNFLQDDGPVGMFFEREGRFQKQKKHVRGGVGSIFWFGARENENPKTLREKCGQKGKKSPKLAKIEKREQKMPVQRRTHPRNGDSIYQKRKADPKKQTYPRELNLWVKKKRDKRGGGGDFKTLN